MGQMKRMESATTIKIDVNGDDIDEVLHSGNSDPDLESVAHSQASSSLS
jgi:hypothetical protein